MVFMSWGLGLIEEAGVGLGLCLRLGVGVGVGAGVVYRGDARAQSDRRVLTLHVRH